METAAATGYGPSQALNRLAISATTHCLTGCAIGDKGHALVHEHHRH
jgi:hypothetical protein